MYKLLLLINQGLKILILLILTCITLFSCKNDKVVLNEDTIVFTEFPKEDTVLFKELFDYKEGFPLDLFIHDSTLILYNLNHNAEYFFFNYSLKSNTLSKGYLRKGKGPNEGLGVASWGIFDNFFWAHDVTLKRILIANIEEYMKDPTDISFIEYQVNEFYLRITFIDSLNFLAAGVLNSYYKVNEVNLISGMKPGGMGEFGYIPEDIPIQACKDAYLSYLYLKPSGDKIVLPYSITDVIEVYDLKHKSCVAVQGPEIIEAEYKVERNVRYGNYFADITKETRKTFLNGTVTDKYIYLVYSGQLEMRNENSSDKGKYIYIYDWDGNPLKRLISNREIYCIAVSPDDKTLYAYEPETGYIVKAEINL